MADRVLLTGISGFLASHIALQLLTTGYHVRGSLRSLTQSDAVRQALTQGGADCTNLEFVPLNLSSDANWTNAARDCRFVIHTASPLTLRMPRKAEDLIAPAVEGTERALNAALAASVERIVMTSSMAAIAYGHVMPPDRPYTASDWTNIEGKGVNAYQKSKTLAERHAWSIMEQAGRREALVSINPAIIFGPVLGSDLGTSVTLIQRLLNGSLPGLPRLSLTTIDVRDVAAAHIAAMTAPSAGGHRFPLGLDPVSLRQLALLLRQHYPERPIPTLPLPDWLIHLYGLFDRDIGGLELNVSRRLCAGDGLHLVGRAWIGFERSVLDTASCIVALGL